MTGHEAHELALERWAKLYLLQQHYVDFKDFAQDIMVELGFSLTEIQADIADYMVNGPQYIMVQAQRGQAKTTIVACFAVWCLIRSPAHRILIVSAGGTQAVEISTLIVRIVMNVDVLECMRPDKQAGDRASVEAFDVHHSLKGLDKSPSVACVGIEANLQGKRADLLIPDDVESSKNGATAVQRARILDLTRDFTSINSMGRIIWLGTPQTMDSIYNSLPARGVAVRIWPGRYPTPEQEAHYGTYLAPLLVERIRKDPSLQTGGGVLRDQGKPIDTVILPESVLTKKELDQGTPYFQLQHMLNTSLTDAMRHPLKLEQLVTIMDSGGKFPMAPIRGMTKDHLQEHITAGYPFKTMSPQELGKDFAALQSIGAYIDPAAGGANADETAYAIGGFLNGNIHLLAIGGIPGGYELPKLELLADILCRFKLDWCTIEKNMGFGAFAAVFTPILRRKLQCQVDDDLVSGQKEARIIYTLAPIMGRGSLIVSTNAIREDDERCQVHGVAMRQTYSAFYQMAKLTRDRDSLVHDDRVDALEGLCRKFTVALAQDQGKAIETMRKREHEALMKNPLGYNLQSRTGPAPRFTSMLNRRRR